MKNNNSSITKKQRGFTLIEMVIAIGLIGVIGVITTEMFSRIILLSKKTSIESEIKRNSETVLAQLERVVRNANQIEQLGIKPVHADSNDTMWDFQTLPGLWQCDTASIPNPAECGMIVRNSEDNTSLYTKIVLSTQVQNVSRSASSTEVCPTSIYNDQIMLAGGRARCNGSVRIQSSNILGALNGGVPRAETPLTNIDLDSGVNITAVNIQVNISADRPSITKFDIQYEQPLQIVFRDSAPLVRNFTATLSLRNY